MCVCLCVFVFVLVRVSIKIRNSELLCWSGFHIPSAPLLSQATLRTDSGETPYKYIWSWTLKVMFKISNTFFDAQSNVQISNTFFQLPNGGRLVRLVTLRRVPSRQRAGGNGSARGVWSMLWNGLAGMLLRQWWFLLFLIISSCIAGTRQRFELSSTRSRGSGLCSSKSFGFEICVCLCARVNCVWCICVRMHMFAVDVLMSFIQSMLVPPITPKEQAQRDHENGRSGVSYFSCMHSFKAPKNCTAVMSRVCWRSNLFAIYEHIIRDGVIVDAHRVCFLAFDKQLFLATVLHHQKHEMKYRPTRKAASERYVNEVREVVRGWSRCVFECAFECEYMHGRPCILLCCNFPLNSWQPPMMGQMA